MKTWTFNMYHFARRARHDMLVCSLALPLLSGAQEEPRMAIAEDEFTGEQSVRAEPVSISQGPGFAWVVEHGHAALQLHWVQSGWIHAVVFEGDTLMLKLDNNDLLVLES